MLRIPGSTLILFLSIPLLLSRANPQRELSDNRDSDSSDDSPRSSLRSQNIPVSLNCMGPDPVCQITSPLPNPSTIYNVVLRSGSTISFEFPIGMSAVEISMALTSPRGSNLRTDIALFSDGTLLDNVLSAIREPTWDKDFIIRRSQFPKRSLYVQITSNSLSEASTFRFGIQRRPVGSFDDDDSGIAVWIIGVSLAAGVFLFIILMTCCCWVYTKRRRQQRAGLVLSTTDRQHPTTERGLVLKAQKKSKDELSIENLEQRFPEAPFSSFYSSFDQRTCSICLEDLRPEQNCRQLYCEHIFHSECIKLWLLNQLKKDNAFCPNCNKDMTKIKEGKKKSLLERAKKTLEP